MLISGPDPNFENRNRIIRIRPEHPDPALNVIKLIDDILVLISKRPVLPIMALYYGQYVLVCTFQRQCALFSTKDSIFSFDWGWRGGGRRILSTLFFICENNRKVIFLNLFFMVKYSHFLKLTRVSADLVSPRPYPYTPLKMSSFGCENNS